MRKIGMTGVIHAPSTSDRFHNGGFTLVMKDIMERYSGSKIEIITEKDDWDIYDIIIINESGNYTEGVFNVFGGIQEKHIDKLHKLCNFKGKLFSFNLKIDYNILVTKRKELKDITFNIPDIQILYMDTVFDKLVLGDSHSLSVYRPGYCISKNDGKTLNGFLKIGLNNVVPENITHLIFYAGNIDIRFHVHRFGGIEAIDILIEKLEKQCLKLSFDRGIQLSLVGLLPIEDESRKVPGTGQYKGENFYGSKEQRQEYSDHFNSSLEFMCSVNGWQFLKWNLGHELLFEDMEQRQSVHLRPSSYMFYNEIKN